MRIVISFEDGREAVYLINQKGNFSWSNVDNAGIVGIVIVPLEDA